MAARLLRRAVALGRNSKASLVPGQLTPMAMAESLNVPRWISPSRSFARSFHKDRSFQMVTIYDVQRLPCGKRVVIARAPVAKEVGKEEGIRLLKKIDGQVVSISQKIDEKLGFSIMAAAKKYLYPEAVEFLQDCWSVVPFLLLGYLVVSVVDSIATSDIPASEYAALLHSIRVFALQRTLDFHKDRMIKLKEAEQARVLSLEHKHQLECLALSHKQQREQFGSMQDHQRLIMVMSLKHEQESLDLKARHQHEFVMLIFEQLQKMESDPSLQMQHQQEIVALAAEQNEQTEDLDLKHEQESLDLKAKRQLQFVMLIFEQLQKMQSDPSLQMQRQHQIVALAAEQNDQTEDLDLKQKQQLEELELKLKQKVQVMANKHEKQREELTRKHEKQVELQERQKEAFKK